MKQERYELESAQSLTVFEFVSVGKKGKIHKVIQFSPTNLKDFYNLGFGDRNEQTGEIDDLSISNNGDTQKVLATVAFSVIAFIDKHPEAWVYATGSTPSRTRLYQMGITNQLIEILNNFDVYGLYENKWEEFIPNKKTYQAFLIRRKSL